MLTRRKVVCIGDEAIKGTAVAPDKYVLAYEIEATPEDSYSDRKPSGKYAGHTQKSSREGTMLGSIKFKTELRCDDSGDWDDAISELLTGCGLSLTTKTFTPTSVPATQKTLTLEVHEDGRMKQIKGAMGDVTIAPEEGVIMCSFEFTGVWSSVVDEALPAHTYATTAPLQWGNTNNVMTVATVATYAQTFSFSTGNSFAIQSSGGLSINRVITDRSPTFECDAEAVLVATQDRYGAWLAGTQLAVSLVLSNGTDQVTLTGTYWQITEISNEDRDGTLVDKISGPFTTETPNTGDNEFSLVAAAVAA